MNRPATDIDEVIVHCLATRKDWYAGKSIEEKVKEVTRWHTAPAPVGRGWKGIAYAAVIDYDGKRGKGRDLDQDGDTFDEIGAHTAGRNSRSVGVALVGGHGSDANDPFEKHFTPAQDIELRRFIKEVEDYVGHPVKVRGHNEFANKACPGFNAARWYAEKPPERGLQGSTTIQATGAGAAATVAAGGTAISQLDGNAQLMAIAFFGIAMLAFIWIARERLKKWARGDR